MLQQSQIAVFQNFQKAYDMFWTNCLLLTLGSIDVKCKAVNNINNMSNIAKKPLTQLHLKLSHAITIHKSKEISVETKRCINRRSHNYKWFPIVGLNKCKQQPSKVNHFYRVAVWLILLSF